MAERGKRAAAAGASLLALGAVFLRGLDDCGRAASRGVRSLDEVADVSRFADEVGEAARLGDEAAALARHGDALGEAAELAEPWRALRPDQLVRRADETAERALELSELGAELLDIVYDEDAPFVVPMDERLDARDPLEEGLDWHIRERTPIDTLEPSSLGELAEELKESSRVVLVFTDPTQDDVTHAKAILATCYARERECIVISSTAEAKRLRMLGVLGLARRPQPGFLLRLNAVVRRAPGQRLFRLGPEGPTGRTLRSAP